MKYCLLTILVLVLAGGWTRAQAVTYNKLTSVNLCDQGIPADQRATNVLLAMGNIVYGATSGDKCHVFRFDPRTLQVRVLATIGGPNTVMKGMVLHGQTIYVGVMLTRRQLWLRAREDNKACELEDANLTEIRENFHTGRLYRITGITGDKPRLQDLGVPVAGQGIHTMAIDQERGLIYGVTYPGGRFFIDTKTGETRTISFGRTLTKVSNNSVGWVEVVKELADLTPGEGEWNNRLVPKAMHVTADGVMYTSGWRGQILKYDPAVADIKKRFSAVGYIPSVPGRQHWNRIDAIAEHSGALYLGTSDGYIVRLDPRTGEMENLGKPVRAIEVMGLAFSTIDGRLYGVNGGGLEGMSRFWCCDVQRGAYEVDYPVFEAFPSGRRVGDAVCTEDGALVIAEAVRVGDLWVLTPGEKREWKKGGVLEEPNPRAKSVQPDPTDRFAGHKKREVDVYPIPSTLHGGSGYTALQADNQGKIYVGAAYYGKTARLLQLDPDTAKWRCIFRSDQLTRQYGRGQGIPGKIHTKLRLGADGKIYGAMKQGYELVYRVRSDIGEAPEGCRGSQATCHFFCYDPATDTAADLGPGWPQEGIMGFDVDTRRAFLYGGTGPSNFFLAYDLEAKRVWNAGLIGARSPSRYMPRDPGDGKVYHRGEVTPSGRHYMTVWDPDEFRLRDMEVVTKGSFPYRHSYASCCGAAGTNTLYGQAYDQLFEMDLDVEQDGKLHVRPVCSIGVEGEAKPGNIKAIERGPDGRIYWATVGGRDTPLALFAWDPKTEKKKYLGACAVGGKWIAEGHCQGMCLDRKGNLAVHVLRARITAEQQEHWRVSEDFYYQDIEERPYYVNPPSRQQGTYYSIYYLKNATAIR